jgi:hypothetical protein
MKGDKMKKLIFLAMLINLSFAFAHEKGNGGGGVKEGGLYRTFYSAGVVVNPVPETEIPGSRLYIDTINSLVENSREATLLISAGLPIADREFYRVLEERMDKTLMKRLLEEYERVSGVPQNKLAIFAITDIAAKTTYLLPSFYKLSEVEQAAILFHEAFWILKPDSNYAQVIEAEMAFQEFVENALRGKPSMKLPRIFTKLVEKFSTTAFRNVATKYALKMDAQFQHAPGLISADAKVSIKDLFFDKSSCKLSSSISRSTFTEDLKFVGFCKFDSRDIQHLIALSRKFPRSLFVKELMNYVLEVNPLIFKRTLYIEKARKGSHDKNLEKFKQSFYEMNELTFNDNDVYNGF